MKNLLSLASAAAIVAGTAAPAMANIFWWLPLPTRPTQPTQPASVPEIDGATSLLAVAAISAAMLFVWERNRRRA